MFLERNICLQKIATSVKSSGKWNVSRISSGVFPSIILARALLVKSTNAFISRVSAAAVNSQSFFVSSLMNLSSNNFLSYKIGKR